MKKAGDLLSNILSDIQKNEGEAFVSFNNSWLNIAGDKIGQNTKIKDIIDGNLIIEIDHPGWKQLILLKEKLIIKQIKKDFPELKVNKIKFYFKNRVLNDKKTSIIVENKINNSIEESNISTDFLSLLKKMNKRSEE